MKGSVLLFFLLLPVLTFAQTNSSAGFIILHSKDTLHGYIEDFSLHRNPEEITFSKDDKQITYTPTELLAFLVNREGTKHLYESHLLNPSQLEKLSLNSAETDKMVFLYVYLKDKPMSLYFYQDKNPLYFIQQNNESLTELVKPSYNEKKLEKFKRVLTFYLADLPERTEKINKLRYSNFSLTHLLKEYNRYKLSGNKAYFIFQSTVSPKSRLGVIAGASYSYFKFNSDLSYFNYLIEGQQVSSIQPVIGFSYTIPLSRLSSKIFLYNELSYRAYHTSFSYTKEDYFWTYRTESHIQTASIKLNSMVRWKSARTRYASFIQAGAWASYSFRQVENSKVIYRKPPTEESYAPYNNNNEVFVNYKKIEFGPAIGTGVSFNNISTELRFEAGTGISEYIYLQNLIYTTSLLVQYEF